MRRKQPMKRSGFTGPRVEIKRSPIKPHGKRMERKKVATAHLRKACRERYPECVASGFVHQCNTGLETAHILGKGAHPALEFDLDNVVTLCHDVHAWFTVHPDDWRKFIEKLLPGRWDELLRRERGVAP